MRAREPNPNPIGLALPGLTREPRRPNPIGGLTLAGLTLGRLTLGGLTLGGLTLGGLGSIAAVGRWREGPLKQPALTAPSPNPITKPNPNPHSAQP